MSVTGNLGDILALEPVLRMFCNVCCNILLNPMKRTLAGAGMRPCGPRARPLCGTPASSSAQCCTLSRSAAAGPPPSRRTGCGTCAGTARLSVRAAGTAGTLPAPLRPCAARRAEAARTPPTSSPRGAARAPAGAGRPGPPPAGPPRRCAARRWPQSARRRPSWQPGDPPRRSAPTAPRQPRQPPAGQPAAAPGQHPRHGGRPRAL